MIKPKLYSRIVGQSCEGAKFKGFHAPSDAVTYDRVKGISKKGKFDIVSFYDKNDELAKRVYRYIDKKGNETLRIKCFSALDTITSEVVAINGKVKEFINKVWEINKKTKEVGCVTERLVKEGNKTRDFHEFVLFTHGKKPRKMSYEAKWDGYAPEIEYTNISARMPREGLEYMPMLVSNGAQARHHHLSLINLRKYGLEGVGHEAQKIKFTELNPQYKSYKDVPEFAEHSDGMTEFDPQTAKVFVSDHAKLPENLIRIYGHEYKHVDDLSHVMRLRYIVDSWNSLSKEDLEAIKINDPEMYKFVTGSIKKGVIEKYGDNPEKYRYYKWLEKYFDTKKYDKQVKTVADQQNHPVEIGPIRESKKEVEKFNSLQENIFAILHSD